MKNRTLSFAARSEMLPFGATPGRRAAVLGTLLAAALTLAPASGVLAQQQHSLPLVNAADRSQQGFIRIINRSDRSGRVTIVATDDSGNRSSSVTLSMGALETRHFNSGDLENGHERRLPGSGVGDGDGDWRLELTTDLEIEPLAYIRTSTGFVTSVHDVVQGEAIPVPDSADVHAIRYHVRFFNPKHDTAPGSRLRLINTSNLQNVVTITGLDDHGNSPPGGAITVTLPAYGARTITSAQLEDGDSGFQGSFGDGFNKWQLFVAPQVGTNPTSTVWGSHVR